MLAPAAACLAASWNAGAADAAPGYDLKIGRQGLERALYALWEDTGLEYKLPTDEAWRNTRTKAISGHFATSEAALRAMLECSRYGYKWLDYPTKVSIIPTEDAPGPKECVLIASQRLTEPEVEQSEKERRPYVVLSREMLEHRQPLTAVDVARQAVVGSGGWSPAPIPGATSPNSVAIAATRTLVDGRDLQIFYSGSISVVAIFGLPVSAIERVEVYDETYFGAGGGSSGSKTVNFVVSRKCDAPRLRVDVGNSFESGSGVRRLYGSRCDMFGGTELQLKAAMSRQQTLRVGERDYVQRARAEAMANDPSSVFLSNTPWLSDRVNVKFLDAQGRDSFTTLSRADIAAKNVAAAMANAGTMSTALANSAQSDGGARASLLDGEDTYYFDVHAKQSFSETVSALFDFVASQAVTRTATSVGDSMGLQSVYVPATAQGNFFHRDLIASVPLEGLDFDLKKQLTGRHVTATLNYEPSALTHVSFDVFGARSALSWSQPTASGAAEAIASGKLDVLSLDKRDVQEWVKNYYSPSQISKSWQVRAEIAHVVLLTSRSRLTFGGRIEQGENDFKGGVELTRGPSDTTPLTVATLPRQTQFRDSALVQASYVFDSPDLQLLEVQLAGRADRYGKRINDQRCVPTCLLGAVPERKVYRSVNPAFNVRYQPGKEWTLNGGFSEGVRIPVSEESGSSTARAVPAATFRGLQGTTPDKLVLVSVGGNPNVGPETMRSWSVGFEFKPSSVPGLSAAVEYTTVKKENEIVIPTDVAYSNFPLFASRYASSIVTLSPADNPFGAPLGLDLRARNIAEAKSRALEGTLSYEWKSLHGFEVHVFTQVHSQLLLERRASPSSPWDDNTGLTAFSPSRFAWNNDLSFKRGPFSIGWVSRYLGDYRFAVGTEGTQSQRVPSQFYQDVQVSYEIGASRKSKIGTELQCGVVNVFNTSPRTDPSQRYSISPLDDPRLRSFLLSATARF